MMLQQTPRDLLRSSTVGARLADKRSHSTSPLTAFDVAGSFFTKHSTALDDFADLYRETFNGIKEVSQPWSVDGARDMIKFHLQHPGVNMALYDSDQEGFTGGFLSTFVPTANGLCLAGQDIFMDKGLQGSGRGLVLYLRSLLYAQEIAKAQGETITTCYSTTYKNRKSPKAIWERSGCTVGPLFNLSATEIMSHASTKADMSLWIEAAHTSDIEQIADFIANSDTVSSDGQKWSYEQGLAYAKFMNEHHSASFVVAKKDTDIVAVSSLQVTPGRSGSTGVGPLCFVSKSVDQDSVIHPSLVCIQKNVDLMTKSSRKQPMTSVDVPSPSEAFFRKSYPRMTEDTEFVSVFGDMDRMTNYFGRLVRNSSMNIFRRRMPLFVADVA